MAVRLNEKEKNGCYDEGAVAEQMRRYFPDKLYFEIKQRLTLCADGEYIEEIRLRSGRQAYLTVGAFGKKRNLIIDTVLSDRELSEIFERMCDGSLYAYSESIISGYISLPSGIRVGVCGRAAVEKGKIFGVYDISALNIRIPRVDIRIDNNLLAEVRKKLNIGQGVLIFAPPAQGKTTCLRSLAYQLASGNDAMRVSMVDTRGELSLMPKISALSLDTLIGYPKAEGIRIATLFMNPEVIVCDEIGGEDEARAIADAQNCGVPLIASAHSSDLYSLMLKGGIASLHRSFAFGAYVALRIGKFGAFTYSWYEREEAQRAFEDNRRIYNNSQCGNDST